MVDSRDQMLVRPVTADDVAAIFELSQQAGVGMTSLQNTPELWECRVMQSLESFPKQVSSPGYERYMWVLEDLSEGRVVGCCTIVACIGSDDPLYSYKISTLSLQSLTLQRAKKIRLLYLVSDKTETTEICSLFLLPAYRKNKNGQLLSRMRFLYMAEHPERFCPQVIAAMRGICDQHERSPFWDHVGAHFFSMPFREAEMHMSQGRKHVIAELMPQCPVYIDLLPKKAQAVLGCVHEETQAAYALLKREGFAFNHYIDIFDAGPMLEAALPLIESVKNSVSCQIARISAADESMGHYILLTCGGRARACIGQAVIASEKKVVVSEAVSKLLEVSVGETLRLVRLGDRHRVG